jgi:hypothetical protein
MAFLPPRRPRPIPLVQAVPRTVLGPNQRWPQYVPYPAPLALPPSSLVPNRTAIDWPQSQFAPQWLPPGSGSVMTYNSNPQTHVLYGSGNPNDVTTPRGSFAGSNYAGAYGEGDDDVTPKERKIAWGSLLFGFVSGWILCKTMQAAEKDDTDYGD